MASTTEDFQQLVADMLALTASKYTGSQMTYDLPARGSETLPFGSPFVRVSDGRLRCPCC